MSESFFFVEEPKSWKHGFSDYYTSAIGTIFVKRFGTIAILIPQLLLEARFHP
jgi:hypothetical protein